uniref:Uncharacterized protein n=1 Tax=Fagus sylvatica TaxID=28930 RepID=A0A2N9F869_FAGSY
MSRRPGIGGLQTTTAAKGQNQLMNKNVVGTGFTKEELATLCSQLKEIDRRYKEMDGFLRTKFATKPIPIEAPSTRNSSKRKAAINAELRINCRAKTNSTKHVKINSTKHVENNNTKHVKTNNTKQAEAKKAKDPGSLLCAETLTSEPLSVIFTQEEVAGSAAETAANKGEGNTKVVADDLDVEDDIADPATVVSVSASKDLNSAEPSTAPDVVQEEVVDVAANQAPPKSVEGEDEVVNAVAAELAAFLLRFNQEEYNTHQPSYFWPLSGPNMSFLGFSVPAEGLPLLNALLEKHGDFTVGFKLGVGTGDFMLHLLCCVLTDMVHSFFETLTETRILEWRSVVRELMSAGFALDFMLDHLRLVAQTLFSRRIKSAVRTLDTQIASLRTSLEALESRRGRLLSASVTVDFPVIAPVSEGLLG